MDAAVQPCLAAVAQATVGAIAAIFNVIGSFFSFGFLLFKWAATAWSGGNFGVGLACGLVVGAVLHRVWCMLREHRVEDNDKKQVTQATPPFPPLTPPVDHLSGGYGKSTTADWGSSHGGSDHWFHRRRTTKFGDTAASIPNPRSFAVPKAPLWGGSMHAPIPDMDVPMPDAHRAPPTAKSGAAPPGPAEVKKPNFDIKLGVFVDDGITSGMSIGRLHL